jgi:hypothetical protein
MKKFCSLVRARLVDEGLFLNKEGRFLTGLGWLEKKALAR